jgi:hypothetical protein
MVFWVIIFETDHMRLIQMFEIIKWIINIIAILGAIEGMKMKANLFKMNAFFTVANIFSILYFFSVSEFSYFTLYVVFLTISIRGIRNHKIKRFIFNKQVITIIGSMSLIRDIEDYAWGLIKKGKMVHKPEYSFVSKKEISRYKMFLDENCKIKIDLADIVFVFNKGQKLGESVRKEIKYAEFNGKKIQYLEKVH